MEVNGAGTRGTGAIPVPTATVRVSDIDELDVWVLGEGTPVVLVHGALWYPALKPLAEELAQRWDHQAIWYHRRGYNDKPTKPASVREQAGDIVKILDALGIDRAHVFGHSAGAPFALELAVENPERVLSAGLLDFLLDEAPSAGVFREVTLPSVEKAQAGDFVGGGETVLEALGGSKEDLERAVPGIGSAMAKDASTWFQVDLPVLGEWQPDPAKVKALQMPVAFLAATGLPPFKETGEILKGWLPELTLLEISTNNHFFPLTATAETAEVIGSWIRNQGTTS